MREHSAAPAVQFLTHGRGDISARDQVRGAHSRVVEPTVEMHFGAALDERLNLPLPLPR